MSETSVSNNSDLTKEWVELNEELNRTKNSHKSHRSPVSNTLITIGVGSASAALCYGLYCTYIGNAVKSQKMMRIRIAAQVFTFFVTSAAFVSAAMINAKEAEKKT